MTRAAPSLVALPGVGTEAAGQLLITAGEDFLDLDVFPPFDQDAEEEDFGQLLGTAEDPQDALVLAEECMGAVCGRWVNQGVVQDEYRNFVRAGRPSGISPDRHPWPDLRTDP